VPSIPHGHTSSPQPLTAPLLHAFAECLRLEVAQGDAAPDTIQTYQRVVAHYLRWCEATAHHPAQATPDTVKAYRRALIDEHGHKPASVALKLTVLRRLYQAAKERGLMPDNPAVGVRAPREKRDPAEHITFLEEGELTQLLASIPHDGTVKSLRDRTLLAMMALQGPRTIELHRANIGDLVRQGDQWGLRVEGKRSRRLIPLRPDLAIVLQQYLEAREAAGEALAADHPLLIAMGNRAGGQRLSRRSIRRVVDHYLNKANLKQTAGRTLSAHSLRHTAATLGLRAGASLRQVQDLLGHQDPKTTAIYAHIEDRFRGNPALGIAVTL